MNRKHSFHEIISFFERSQYFEHVEEIEWAIEVCKESGKPVAANMCIGPEGDMHGIPTGECAIRMARAGRKSLLTKPGFYVCPEEAFTDVVMQTMYTIPSSPRST